LPKVFWIKYIFPKEYEGINIIVLPKELRSFLVVFSLKTASQTRQFAIVLPGPSTPGLNVYDFITNRLCVGDGSQSIQAVIERLPKMDYLRKIEHSLACHWYWQDYTNENYKPNFKETA
jgi:hypothetical protein